MFGKTLREHGFMLGVASLAMLTTTIAGCAGARLHYGRRSVGSEIESRTRYALGPAPDPCEACIPPGVDWDDGLLEDEAVAIALWNNAAYQELLAELGLTRADVIEAAQLTNPSFSTMFPVGVKQWEFTLTVPLEALWLRPIRLAAARRRSQETANRLVQDGLDLIRDVRVAYADLVLAQDLLQIAVEGAELRGRIARLADSRVRAGSASGLDASTSRIDHMVEAQRAAQLEHEVELARQRLRRLLGMRFTEIALEPVPPTIPDPAFDLDALVGEALLGRPDLWAAELAHEAARHRAKLARRDYFHVAAMLPDANGDGKKGFEAGPGLEFTVPIFNQNQGAIARADAEVDRARRHVVTVRDTIALEVQQAYTRCVQAREALQTWDDRIVPAVEDAVAKAEKAYQAGGTSLLLMLETSRRLLDSQVERAQAAAELRRAAAELERSVGGGCSTVETRRSPPWGSRHESFGEDHDGELPRPGNLGVPGRPGRARMWLARALPRGEDAAGQGGPACRRAGPCHDHAHREGREAAGHLHRRGPTEGDAAEADAGRRGDLPAGPDGNGVPPPGARVTRGAPIFTLLPLMSSERSVLTSAELMQMAEARAGLETLRTEAKQQAALAEIQVEAAGIALARAEQLLRDQAGSRQAVDEAKAQSDLAQKTLETARERLALLEKTTLDADAGNLRPLTITAPVTGVLSSFGAVSGELVVAGKTLFEVISQDRVWVRVPVYVGQWGDVDTEKVAKVTEFGRPPDDQKPNAKPIAAPPSANPDAATVDMFYELDNEDGHFRPGHKVAVTLPLKGEVTSLVAPWSAVLHDIHGGTWVYEEISPQTFVRRRVHVRFVSGAEAVLADGLKPGTRIVTDGAAELFGTEFGFGK